MLAKVWPQSTRGSVLVTSRDSTAGFGTNALSCQVHTFSEDVAVTVLLKLTGKSDISAEESRCAVNIVRTLGGLPLAINQIGGFIVQQKLSFAHFFKLYEKNSAKIDARRLSHSSNEHTLSTVWECSLTKLSLHSRILQNMLAFLDPDGIHEDILKYEGVEILDDSFDFLGDDME